MLDSYRKWQGRTGIVLAVMGTGQREQNDGRSFLGGYGQGEKPDALTPSWSFTALLELLPSEIENGSKMYSLGMKKIGEEYQMCYSDEDSHNLYSILEDTPVNAAFKMLCLLNEIKDYN